jgi:hypothetical protein
VDVDKTKASSILQRVANGELSPQEAAALLEESERLQAPSAATREPPARVRLIRTTGSADIVGDSSVREVVVEGPHRLRREDDAVVVEALDLGGGERVRLWMNPDLALSVEGRAGSVSVRDVRAPIRCEALAGSTRIESFSGPISVSLLAGSVRASGRLDHGHSTVSCDAGSVQLHLERGSSVRVTAAGAGARVSVEGRRSGRSWVIGGGTGTLDLSARTGSIRVTSEAE